MTPTQLRAAIEQLEREGYVLCKKEPVTYCVFDEDGQPGFTASVESMCHDHINDAINEHDFDDAGKWRVVPLHSKEPAMTPTTVQVRQVIEHLDSLGLIVCARVAATWVRYADDNSDNGEEDLEFTSLDDPDGFPLYAAAPSYSGGE